MAQTLLVTGGAGFVGSHVAHELLARKFKVVIIDNLQQGHRRAVPEGAVFVEGDLADRAGLDLAVQAASLRRHSAFRR